MARNHLTRNHLARNQINGGAVLLAAGFGRRFGSDKRRYVLAGQQMMLVATLEAYLTAFDRVVVVLRPSDADLAELLTRAAEREAERTQRPITVECVICHDAELGMGHSLAAGARAAAGWDYLFVGLGDMPFIRPATLTVLRDALLDELAHSGGDAIVEPIYQAAPGDAPMRGHPVGFGAAHLPELAACAGDVGARALLRQHAQQVTRVPVTDRGVLLDVDRPEQAAVPDSEAIDRA